MERPIPEGRPPWILRQIERLRYPALWDVVETHWFAPGQEDRLDEEDVAGLLTAHIDYVLHNQFRAEYGLLDPTAERWKPLVTRDAARPAGVVVDGVVTDGVIIDNDPFVLGLGAPLHDGRVLTAVAPRALLDLVTLEFVADAPHEPVASAVAHQ